LFSSEYNAAFDSLRTRILISNGTEDDINISQAYAVVYDHMAQDIDSYAHRVCWTNIAFFYLLRKI